VMAEVDARTITPSAGVADEILARVTR
jgi:hypothetical protein